MIRVNGSADFRYVLLLDGRPEELGSYHFAKTREIHEQLTYSLYLFSTFKL